MTSDGIHVVSAPVRNLSEIDYIEKPCAVRCQDCDSPLTVAVPFQEILDENYEPTGEFVHASDSDCGRSL